MVFLGGVGIEELLYGGDVYLEKLVESLCSTTSSIDLQLLLSVLEMSVTMQKLHTTTVQKVHMQSL